MNILRIAVICIAALLTASCSEQPALNSDSNGQAEEAQNSSEAAGAKDGATGDAIGDDEKAEQDVCPDKDIIAEDSVAFLRATIAAPPDDSNAGCPSCPPGDLPPEVLQIRGVDVGKVSPAALGCEVVATLHATFNPSTSRPITGGLTGWMSPEQREQYLHGETPAGEQVYRLKIHYRRTPKGFWRATEFDRAPSD